MNETCALGRSRRRFGKPDPRYLPANGWRVGRRCLAQPRFDPDLDLSHRCPFAGSCARCHFTYERRRSPVTLSRRKFNGLRRIAMLTRAAGASPAALGQHAHSMAQRPRPGIAVTSHPGGDAGRYIGIPASQYVDRTRRGLKVLVNPRRSVDLQALQLGARSYGCLPRTASVWLGVQSEMELALAGLHQLNLTIRLAGTRQVEPASRPTEAGRDAQSRGRSDPLTQRSGRPE